MARRPRLLMHDGIYHVSSRGDRQEPVYEDDADRKTFLRIVSQGMRRFEAHAHAYCLMGNHYHLLVETPCGNLSKLMRHINGVYTQASNRRHERVGHVFQGRFYASLVDRDAYFMEACRYVDLNPIRAGLVEDVALWRWSSYRAHAGLDPAPEWLNSSLLHACIAPRCAAGEGAIQYRRFVAQGLTQAEVPSQGAARSGAGSSSVSNAWETRPRPELAWYFRSFNDRDEAIHAAFVDGAYSTTQIAQAVGLSVSRVSQLVKQVSADAFVRPDYMT